MRLHAVFIARCTACIAVVIGAAVFASLPRRTAPSTALHRSDDGPPPLDIANPAIRRALIGEEWLYSWDDVPSLLRTCAADETYRVFYQPGMGTGDFRLVDVSVEGGSVVVIDRTPDAAARTRGLAWRTRSTGHRAIARLDAVRATLTRLLAARTAPVISDAIVDASRVRVETCREGRYYFFDRAIVDPSMDIDPAAGDAMTREGDARVGDLARALLQLADRRGDTPASTATR